MTPRHAGQMQRAHDTQNISRDDIPGESNPQSATTSDIALIAAVAANGVIGADERIPWRLPEDLKRFRAMTTGHAVIMGRKTWESLPRALSERQNIVVTRQANYVADGADVSRSLDEALTLVRLPQPVFCIGGGELYRAALPYATRLYLTEIARDFPGDATFPAIAKSDWREVSREAHEAVEPDSFAYAYVTFERVDRRSARS